MKYKYNGTDDRVFPSLALVIKAGEEFEAPDDFVASDVAPVGSKGFTKQTPSASPDITVGE